MTDQGQAPEALSNREQEVAAAYAAGQSYKEIARELGLSPTTVRSHLRTIYSKLGVTSKIELAQFLNDASVPGEGRDTTTLVADLALELDEAVRRERSLAKILKIISQQENQLEPVIDALLDHALEICEAEFGILFEYQGDMRYRELQSRGISPAFAAWLNEQGAFAVEAETGLGRVASSLRTVNIADVRGEDVYKSQAPLRIATADLGKARSFAAIPMMSGDRLIGTFTVYRTRVHPFNDRALELAQLFADQAVIAIENVRQFRELQTRLERAAVNREILQVISRCRDNEQPVFDAILENACRLCKAQMGAFVLGREIGDKLVMVAHRGATKATQMLYRDGHYTMKPGRSHSADAILQRKIVHIEDMAKSARYLGGDPRVRSLVDEQGIRTNLFVPLISQGEGIGCLILFRSVVHPYTDDQIAMVETFATQAVIAIENVRQFRELQVRLERAAATREILQVISQSRDDDVPVFEAIVSNAGRLCGDANVALHLADQARTHAIYVAGWGDPTRNFEVGVSKWPLDDSLPLTDAIREARVINIPDSADDKIYNERHPDREMFLEKDGIRSQLVVPLLADGQGIGCFEIYRRELQPFSEDEVALVESFASQAVIAIENVRQFRELQMRLEREAAARHVLDAISRSRNDEAPVFDVIVENARRLCDAPTAALILGQAGDEHQVMAAHHGAIQNTIDVYRDGGYPMDPKVSFGARAILEKRVIHLHDMKDTDEYRRGLPSISALVDNQGIRTNLLVPLIAGGEGIGCLILHRSEIRPYTDDQIALVETFAAQAVMAIENVRQFKALEARTAEVQALNTSLEVRVNEQVGEIERMGRLKRFLSPAVADALVASGDETVLASHRALIATLFCDIRGFTAFCETAEPEETIEVLQTYHEEMGNLISAHGGGVDKRMGDGIMVIFNDPLPCEDPAGDAVRLAVAMRERMVELCNKWKRLGHRLGFGVGISFGYATIGMVGSEGRYDYTASGTAVNLAARLSDRAEDGEILLSPRAYTAVEDDFKAESSGEVSLKGIREPVEVFRLMDAASVDT